MTVLERELESDSVCECMNVCVWDECVWVCECMNGCVRMYVCDECARSRVCVCENHDLKQNEAQCTCEEPTHKGVK